jgi:hypothetical protein
MQAEDVRGECIKYSISRTCVAGIQGSAGGG